ncbi:pro-corazonin [Apis laboriosa]|uniref:pro-corazonin n=2 Tax=Apis TaxID=7459 RepID=UPI001CC618FB|nr:pro-corazonin [Apis laboriosa]
MLYSKYCCIKLLRYKMVNSQILILFILSLTITIVMCQMFTYSHGWTNGKRSTSLEELVNRNPIQSDNVFANCELQKLRLLLQGNINNQLFQMPCELLNFPKRSFSENMINDHRQPAPTDNNY